MNAIKIRSAMLNKTFSAALAWLRAGYSPDASQFGHVALVALCPTTGGDLRQAA